MFRTLILTFIAVAVCGCQAYNVTLDLPENLSRIEIGDIQCNSPFFTTIITESLSTELAKDFTITNVNPDITISGMVQLSTIHSQPGMLMMVGSMGVYYGTEHGGPPYVTYAKLKIDTPTGPAGTIESKAGETEYHEHGPEKFAEKIKNILTKNR